jgi:tRNA A37 threonylcarbamoyladenosine synthetase subunit TsaC/SUA5/YrdC
VTTTAVPGEPDRGEAAETEVAVTYRRFDCTANDPSRNAEATEAAREAIEAGECIVLPTDTVYGIGADAFSAEAVRSCSMPNTVAASAPPVLSRRADLDSAPRSVPEPAKGLVEKHWPGALTVIVASSRVCMDLSDTEEL